MQGEPWLGSTVVTLLVVVGLSTASCAENPLRSVFPYGVYVSGNNPEWTADAGGPDGVRDAIDRVCQDLAAHNMNCAWPNNLRWENLPLWLEAGRKHGIRIVPQGGGPPGFVRAKWFADKDDFAKRVGPFYRKLAEKYADDEALLAWCLTEENKPEQWFYEAMRDLTVKMAEWDPTHPVITMDNKAAAAWMNASVVKPRAFCRDVYVFFADGLNGPYDAMGFRSLLTRECRLFREAAEVADSVFWIMGQGMELVGRGPGREHLSWRYPTPEEMRWQVWASIQQGAKGFFFFMYRGPENPPARGEYIRGLRDGDGSETPQYRVAAEVGRQLQALAPVLLDLDFAPPHQSVVYWENTPVSAQTFVHRQTGRRFLIAVNHDCAHIQPVGIELGYFPQMLGADDRLFDLKSGRMYEYQSLKLATLLPGDGTVYFIGTEEEWETFSKGFYPQE